MSAHHVHASRDRHATLHVPRGVPPIACSRRRAAPPLPLLSVRTPHAPPTVHVAGDITITGVRARSHTHNCPDHQLPTQQPSPSRQPSLPHPTSTFPRACNPSAEPSEARCKRRHPPSLQTIVFVTCSAPPTSAAPPASSPRPPSSCPGPPSLQSRAAIPSAPQPGHWRR
eukprot:350077-Chlamydomonas_euryale.AAC.5